MDMDHRKASRVITFSEGSYGEDYPWEIRIDHPCSKYGGRPCRHARNVEPKTMSHEKRWICPRVVVAYNEGRYNMTGVCLDCILEAAKGL